MPSSPAEPRALLSELATIWDHAYEALVRGDLPRVATLLDSAEPLLRQLPRQLGDDVTARNLLRVATTAHGRLQAAMQHGLEQVRVELVQVRQGQRVLAGYSDPTHGVGRRVHARA
ncbi:MAG: hypothetical protein IPK26_31105 [Planctomycetes bacterium]|nr:hypothetical protein [Planctomycetota bacterium]